MLLKNILLPICCCMVIISYAQKPTITLVDTSKKVSIRGLSVVDDNVVWCSGSNGSVARSVDGGKTFVWQTITGYEKRDFRDIEAFDANTAIIMGIAEPAIILKTKDGGQTWKKVFEDSTKGMFLDAMDFDKKGNGAVIGDPVNNHRFLATTKNKGDSWEIVLNINYYKAGEAYFASSGTNLKIIKQKFGFSPPNYLSEINVSGGLESNLSINQHTLKLPIVQGKESTGANSIDVWKNKAVVVGGDFTNDKDTTGNFVLVDFQEFPKFSFPQTPPHGYRSCVIYINEKTLITCGTSGVDVSYDGGNNWQLISTQSFHVVQKAKNGKAIFLAGSRGKIARLEL